MCFCAFFLSGVDKQVVSKRVVLAYVPSERKPERGSIRMFPGTKNQNEGAFANFACSPRTKMGHTPSTGGTFRKKFRKILERPRKRSQSVSWNSPREYDWDLPSPIIQGILGLPEHFQNSLPLSTAGDLFFPEMVPERASQSWSCNSQQYWGH